MRRDLALWIGLVVAMIIGGLVPGPFLRIHQPSGHFGWRAMWVMIAPFCAIFAGLLWAIGVYFYRRSRKSITESR